MMVGLVNERGCDRLERAGGGAWIHPHRFRVSHPTPAGAVPNPRPCVTRSNQCQQFSLAGKLPTYSVKVWHHVAIRTFTR